MPDTVYLDVECHFRSGRLLCLTVQDGRDSLTTDGTHLRIALQPVPEVQDIYGPIALADLDYLRTTRRVVPEETTTTDGGSLQVTGETPTP